MKQISPEAQSALLFWGDEFLRNHRRAVCINDVVIINTETLSIGGYKAVSSSRAELIDAGLLWDDRRHHCVRLTSSGYSLYRLMKI